MEDNDPIFDTIIGTVVKVIFGCAALVVMAPTLQRVFAATPAAQSYAAQVYVGSTDYRVLQVDEQLRWLSLVDGPPFMPWITASFFNDGPDTAFVAINNPDVMGELKKGENKYADFSFAQRRIEIIFYKTDPGKRANVRVEAKY